LWETGRLHNEELHNLYASPNIIRAIKSRRIRWAGHVAPVGATEDACNMLVGKREKKKLLEVTRHGCVYNIRMDLGK
jgi:hypothetical protein